MDGLDMTTYQYLLEGFDEEWSGWDRKNEKEYTNLYEGSYSFKVRAKNLYGQISEETQYHFTILPPWYRTKIAYSAYFILFSVSLMTLLGFITQRHKKEKSRMLINQKNEFITQVKQNLTSMVRNNPKDPLASDLEKIMVSIDRNITDDDDWQHFEIHFDQVHGDFSERSKTKYPNLSPQDRRLCAYLRMNMTTKEIANLLNITVKGAEISRYRLRKKLGLSRDTNLAENILNF